MVYSKDEIERIVRELGREQAWNHAIEFPYGVHTASTTQSSYGKNLVKWNRIKHYIGAIDLRGKRVLDMGCNDGFFSLKMSQAGAREVIGIDISEFHVKKARFVMDAFGVQNVTIEQLSIYDNALREMGSFDFVLCMGFLHRVQSPLSVVEVLAEISNVVLWEWKSLRESSHGLPIMKFSGVRSIPSDDYSVAYFLPSVICVVEMVKYYGFHHIFVVDESKTNRAIVISSKEATNLVGQSSFMTNQRKVRLLLKYTKAYLRTLYSILQGKIEA